MLAIMQYISKYIIIEYNIKYSKYEYSIFEITINC